MFANQGSSVVGFSAGMGQMANEVMKKLFESFRELEDSLQVARESLSGREPRPEELLLRIAHYEQILQKQKKLAHKLCEYISVGDWNEVSRHIRLINGLTALIYGDANELGLEPHNQKAVGNLS